MATTHSSCRAGRGDQQSSVRINLDSVALLFVSVVSVALGLIEIVIHGLTPLALLPGLVVGFVSILRLRA